MACDTNCKKCDVIDLDYMKIQSFNVNPNPASPGDSVSISFTIQNTSFVGALTTVACLYDESGVCMTSTTTEIGAYGAATITWANVFSMGYKSRNLNVSVVTRSLTFTSCNDSYNFTVDVYSPPGTQRYACAGSQCVPDVSGPYIVSNCNNECTGGGGGFGVCSPACTSGDMCVLGACIPKPLVFVGIAGFLFIMISGGRR